MTANQLTLPFYRDLTHRLPFDCDDAKVPRESSSKVRDIQPYSSSSSKSVVCNQSRVEHTDNFQGSVLCH